MFRNKALLTSNWQGDVWGTCNSVSLCSAHSPDQAVHPEVPPAAPQSRPAALRGLGLHEKMFRVLLEDGVLPQ